jgi:LytS/YehU family sensor histidine kinase
MLIQPFVENALQHGLLPLKQGKGHLVIRIEQKEQQLHISVSDNGIGRQASKVIRSHSAGNGKGVLIPQKRVALLNQLFPQGAELRIRDLKNGQGQPAGTSVSIRLPLLTADTPGVVFSRITA